MNEKISIWTEVLDWLKVFVVAFLVAFFIKFFIFDLTIVKGHSMDHTLADNDLLFIDKFTSNFMDYDYGDIITINAPDVEESEKEFYIKRIIGLPGDTVEITHGQVYINGELLNEKYINSDITYRGYAGGKFTLEEDEYFVMGDNRELNASHDSRNFGPIKSDSIVGRAFFRMYPFKNAGCLE